MDFLGAEGQARIAATRAAIVGAGGLGCYVAQQLAYLGVTHFAVIDADTVSHSNLNRLIGAGPGDIGTPKVDVAARLISSIQPNAHVATAALRFTAEPPSAELAGVTVVFGCVDDDAARLELVRFASAYALPYIDLLAISPQPANSVAASYLRRTANVACPASGNSTSTRSHALR